MGLEPNKTYIIQHKETKELFKAFTGKKTWTKPHIAKASFNRMAGVGRLKGFVSFDQQEVYELKEVKHRDTYLLARAVRLLTNALHSHLPDELENEIQLLLEESGNV